MKIASVELFEVSCRKEEYDLPSASRQAQPLDIYPEFNHDPDFHARPAAEARLLFVEVTADTGQAGIYGPIDETQGFLIQTHLAPFLCGKEALAVEALNDQMMRLNRHGRVGLYMTAISAVDMALWDLKGKLLGQPVYSLLGGPTRPGVPAYASMLGASIEPARAAATALEMKSLGFTAQKWFFRYGPSSGQAGLEQNLAMAFAVREAVGAHYPLAFDAYNGWTEPYALEMLRQLAPLSPWWVEEIVPPERVDSLARIRRASGVPLATGEHVYTRWQVRELLAAQALDYVQTDPDWTGGISEQVKICALASAYNLPVIAHGHSVLPALHIAASQSPAVVPMVEYLVRLKGSVQHLFQEVILPKNGELPLPRTPGLGMDLRPEVLATRRALRWKKEI